MTSDERVVLIPSEHETWAQLAAGMAARVSDLLPAAIVEHIGSTAVAGMPAKPVVDLAVGVVLEQVEDAAHELARSGFDIEGERPGHVWLSYPDRKARSFVVHVLEAHGTEWCRRLRFRDILSADETQRDRYLAAKQAAAAVAQGWGEYTRAKSSVVTEILAEDNDRVR